MPNQTITDNKEQNLQEVFHDFSLASKFTKFDKAGKLLGQADLLMESKEGLTLLYQYIKDFTDAGIFEGTAWADPSKLVPRLVSGTLKSGHPNSTIELLSELRILAIAEKHFQSKSFSQNEAENFIQEVIVSNLEFVFNEPLEETRLVMSQHELNKVHAVFRFLSEKIKLDAIKEKLAQELTLICAQRPVVTEGPRKIIALIKEKIELDPNRPEDWSLLKFQRCIYRPTENTADKNAAEYGAFLPQLSTNELKNEASQMGKSMAEFGLVSQYHAVLLLFLIKNEKFALVPPCLALDPAGEARWKMHREFVTDLILQTIHPYNAQCIFGLAKMLEKGILSRDAVRSGLYNLSTVKIHPEVEKRILKSTKTPHESVSPKQYLMGALFRVLGQPLGLGQGNNPTCQSARGISMWSQHAPAKLINMVQTAATVDDLSFRFEGQEIKASETGKGLVQNLDHNLDAVSVTLVPLLDRIYNEMMLRASGRGEDPHKWVNPALYGQWVQIGFASAYDYPSNAIVDFEGFTKIFYAMCHPLYNGGHRLIYPNPVGIFITSAKGEMLGFHAVSLHRVDKDPKGIFRVYFVNPNNEGRQDWGQGIKPSVFGNGENYGESSLPFEEFAGRIYAFHYNNLEAPEKMETVPNEEVLKVKKIAKESWGRAYTWLEIKKKW
ncbi:hypothetical protein A33Q_0290 [Indibacter alkaliphilus LW1]|uniref:Uncharacterized protein n=1 Tax=Indibacter alkaliphilus (strain CCUG 57479 / KCTC 22604 / LW1) TaxID=1189612 RepID=S2E5H8_INDAL|nr:hypothetical protein [Indibacter alkaliphilus]EOZ99871.1 hypothetical protein A33Q_0290 [Indibacter alkaliphilus LW1]